MPIHIEAITVIVRASAMSKVSNGVAAFKRELRNQTFATDGTLLRGAFMRPADAEDFVARLESLGLTFELNGIAFDIAVADQLRGLTVPAPWLSVYIAQIGMGQSVLCATLEDGVRDPIAFPDSWTYQESLYVGMHFVPSAEEGRMLAISTRGGIDSFVDLESGGMVHRAASVNHSIARTARPPFLMARSDQDVYQREEECIELVRRDAVAGNQPMPLLIMPLRRWWRPNSERRGVYERPNEKNIGRLAEMYEQTYRSNILVSWIRILYGEEVGRHYRRLLQLRSEERARADRVWLERDQDAPLPSRRSMSSDWLREVEVELPRYDLAVRPS